MKLVVIDVVSNPARPAWVATTAVLLAIASRADDGTLSWGGSATLMHGKTKVKMVSERVDIRVVKPAYKGTVYVNCVFVFQNVGPACNVRIGFPDKGEGAQGSDYGEKFNESKDEGKTLSPYTALKSFRSWVDGRRVATQLVPGRIPGDALSWHVKVVHFKAHQTRTIRDSYSQSLGGGATASSYRHLSATYLWDVAYQMSTATSWYGSIGKVTLSVEMPFRVTRATLLRGAGKAYQYKHWDRVKLGQVYYDGFAKPRLRGRLLTFSRANVAPKNEIDVHVYWPIPHGRGFMGEVGAHGQ